MTNPTEINETIKAAAEGVKALVTLAAPIYEDALQPTTRVMGQAAGTVLAGVLDPATLPFSTASRLSAWIKEKVEEKLKGVPRERRQMPPSQILGHVLAEIDPRRSRR